ncbi:MAG: MBL fold metallo-hydrolase [Ignavibacteriales bacterium]|nr:MBL fold metallo-hydrolase [Ignavibacteriales bacterium]
MKNVSFTQRIFEDRRVYHRRFITARTRFFYSSDQPKGFKLIHEKLGIFTDRGGTIAWFVDKNAAAVIDSQFPESAKNFIDGLKQKTDRKIDRLFNTHHHQNHTSGNIFLKNYTDKIVAHENGHKEFGLNAANEIDREIKGLVQKEAVPN